MGLEEGAGSCVRAGERWWYRLAWRGLGLGGAEGDGGQAAKGLSASARQFAGHQRRFPLRQVLGGGDVVPCDLRLLRRRRRQLLVFDLRFGHVVVTGVEILLLQRCKIQIFKWELSKKSKTSSCQKCKVLMCKVSGLNKNYSICIRHHI